MNGVDALPVAMSLMMSPLLPTLYTVVISVDLTAARLQSSRTSRSSVVRQLTCGHAMEVLEMMLTHPLHVIVKLRGREDIHVVGEVTSSFVGIAHTLSSSGDELERN
jgi:hypothetical protein